MIGVAWRFLRLQRECPLVKWFEQRTADAERDAQNHDRGARPKAGEDEEPHHGVDFATTLIGLRSIIPFGPDGFGLAFKIVCFVPALAGKKARGSGGRGAQ